jgi:transcriptional/translational regulatory protein YebC/TACO1
MEDFEVDGNTVYAYGDYTDFGTMSQAFEDKGIEIAKADLQRFPTSAVEFSDEQMIDIEKMLDKFEDDEDIQAVFTNIG